MNELKETGATLMQLVYNSLGGTKIATAGSEKAEVPSPRTRLSLPPPNSHNLHPRTSSSCGILPADRMSLADAVLPCQARSFVLPLKRPTHSDELKWWPILPSSYLLHFRAPSTLDMETRVTSSVSISSELITKNTLPPKHLLKTCKWRSFHH